MVIAYHLMWTAYGWWLPNDPRGSTSKQVNTPRIANLSPHQYGRKQIQPCSRQIREFYAQAAGLLEHPLLEFSLKQFGLVGEALSQSIARHRYTCYACAVMPDHVHLVIRKHRDSAEEMIEFLQNETRDDLRRMGIRDIAHPTWTKGGWKVYLDHPDGIWRTISYVENNPDKLRLAKQRWDWIVPYDNWPLHPEHSENSPYVKALKAIGRYP